MSYSSPPQGYRSPKQVYSRFGYGKLFLPAMLGMVRCVMPAGANAPQPPPLSFWTNGVYVSSIPGALNGNVDVPVANIPSEIGPNTLAVSSPAPLLIGNGVGGLNAAYLAGLNGAFNYFACDALAQYFRPGAPDWTVALQLRIDKSGEYPIFTATSADNSERVQLRVVNQFFVFRKYVGGVKVSEFTGPISPDPFSDILLALVSKSGVLTLYQQASGQATYQKTVLGTMEGTTLSGSTSKFTFLASVSSVPYEGLSGYVGKMAMAPLAATEAQINGQFYAWRTGSYLALQSQSPGAIDSGDSIMFGATQDSVSSEGTRLPLAEFWGQEALSFYTYGGIQAGGSDNGYGAGRAGFGRNTFTSSLSGQAIIPTANQALLDIANAPGKTRYWHCYFGIQDIISGDSAATYIAKYIANFTLVMNALIAKDSRAFVTITPPIPYSTTIQPASTTVDTVHGLFAAQILAPLQAAFPGRVYAYDAYVALNSAWSALYFGADVGHPLRLGYMQMGMRPGFGILSAVNELAENIVTRFRRESPSASKPVPLASTITAPAPAAALSVGTPATVTVVSSRMAQTPSMLINGVTRALSWTVVDISVNTLQSGGYIKVPKISYSAQYTPLIGDIGAKTLTVKLSDPDGVTNVTSAGVAVTIS